MKKSQAGQTLIIVLILLAIGATLVIPMLQFTSTISKGSQIVTQDIKALYAAEGGQDYVMWKLVNTDYIKTFTPVENTDSFQVDVCGTPVNVGITMRAVASWLGVTLATDDVIKPTKSVLPTTNDDSIQTYTYTINLEQISGDTSEGLDAIYDILPVGFEYTGNCQLSVDGDPPEDFDFNPSWVSSGDQYRLRWPAEGNFPSPIRDFYPGQVKELSFEVQGRPKQNSTAYNWVVLSPWNTLSGPQAPITRGTGLLPQDGQLDVIKTADLTYVLPNTPTPVRYDITMRNLYGSAAQVLAIHDYLPDGFVYIQNSTSGIITDNPEESYEDLNGIDRWHLKWITDFSLPQDGSEVTLSFSATATQSDTGSYFNELMVIPNKPVPTLFSDLGIDREDFNSSYSWNASPVLVPAYDSETEASGTTIGARIGITPGIGAWVSSWQVR